MADTTSFSLRSPGSCSSKFSFSSICFRTPSLLLIVQEYSNIFIKSKIEEVFSPSSCYDAHSYYSVAHHEKQGADTHDRTNTPTHHVLPRLADLPAQPGRNYRAAFLRTTCLACRTPSLDDRDGGPAYGGQPGLVVPAVDGRGRSRSCPHRALGPCG